MNAIEMPRDFTSLTFVVLLMGMKHGLDADHLAAIDGLTRYNALERPRLARVSGILFAAGHGIVVVAVAVGLSELARTLQLPRWLGLFGTCVSIAALTLIALVNMVSVLRAPVRELAAIRGWRSAIFTRLLHARSPVLVVGVGTLFALSFDTLSQATLFAAIAARFGGWFPALALSTLFIAGMASIDGLNGAWVARLVLRSDQSARAASRVMALAVSGVGLLTASLALATFAIPGVDAWTQGKELWFGAAVIGIVGISLAWASHLARSRIGTPCMPTKQGATT
jgi:high-affinity nickel-transport protein